MGGYGSTRWGRYRPAPTVEASNPLPLSTLKGAAGTISWTRRGAPAGDIGYTRQGDRAVTLSYTITLGDGPAEPLRYTVPIVTRTNGIGRRMQYLQCGCGRTVKALYRPNGTKYFRCRHCHRLAYQKGQTHNRSYDYLAALLRGDLEAFYRFQARTDHGLPASLRERT